MQPRRHRCAAFAALALAAGCGTPAPAQYARVKPVSAVAHARGDQAEVSAEMGAPDSVRIYLPSGVSRWVYCGVDGDWSRVVDFDAEGNVLVSIAAPTEAACDGTAAPEAPQPARRRRSMPRPYLAALAK